MIFGRHQEAVMIAYLAQMIR